MAKLSAKTQAKIRALVDQFPLRRSAVMPALHYAQGEVGYLDDDTLLEIAEILEVPKNMTTEVVGFYSMFDRTQRGKYKIEVCRNLSCALRGSSEMTAHIKQKLGIEVGGTTADGKFTLLEAECLGACGYAPMLAIGPYFYENLTRETLDSLLDALAQDKEPPIRPAGFLDKDFDAPKKMPVEHPVPNASKSIADHLAVWGAGVVKTAGAAQPTGDAKTADAGEPTGDAKKEGGE